MMSVGLSNGGLWESGGSLLLNNGREEQRRERWARKGGCKTQRRRDVRFTEGASCRVRDALIASRSVSPA
jgi:hypothetical protein